MIYRPIEQEESRAFLELQARAFFFSVDKNAFGREMSNGRWMNYRGAFRDDGSVCAGLELIALDAWFDGAVVGMGGIGGVASNPEDRHGGTVRGLMSAALEEMADRGFVFSCLYPFSAAYYRKFGYEVCQRSLRLKAPVAPLLAHRRPGRAERFVPGENGSDPTPFVEIYNDFACNRNLCVDREGWHWRALLEQDPLSSRRQAYTWLDGDGVPQAYVVLRGHTEKDPTELRVLDAAWRGPDGLLGLLGFLGGYSSILKTVVWTLPAGLPVDLFWPDCGDVKAEIAHGPMCRVVNAQKALKHMRKPFGKGSVRIAVRDDGMPRNAGVYKVDWENGEGTARRARGETADIVCTAQALAQLVTGYLPLAEALYRRDVELNAREEELARLFTGREVFHMEHY